MKRFEVTREEVVQNIYEVEAIDEKQAKHNVEFYSFSPLRSHNCGALKGGKCWIYEMPTKEKRPFPLAWICGIGMVMGIVVIWFAL